MAWLIGIGIALFLLFAFLKPMWAMILLLVIAAAGLGGWLPMHGVVREYL